MIMITDNVENIEEISNPIYPDPATVLRSRRKGQHLSYVERWTIYKMKEIEKQRKLRYLN